MNQFQFDLGTCRTLMAYQKGVEMTIPKSAICQHWVWDDDLDHFTAQIIRVSKQGRFIATGLCRDGIEIDITASLCMLQGSNASWNTIPRRIIQAHTNSLVTPNHINSMHRAKRVVEALVAQRGDISANDVILTLDGNCENRIAMQSVLSELDECRRPRIVTVEMSPEVAFAQRMMSGGSDVIYTGSDPRFRFNELVGGRTSTPKLEHLLVKPNNLLSSETKRSVVAAYFDYCGGPVANQTPDICRRNMCNVVAQLPRLEVLAVTISKRKHADLLENFDRYVTPPDDFIMMCTHRLLCLCTAVWRGVRHTCFGYTLAAFCGKHHKHTMCLSGHQLR